LNSTEEILGLPEYKIIEVERVAGEIWLIAEDGSAQSCPACGCKQLRNKGVLQRKVRHASWAGPRVWLLLKGKHWLCKGCGKRFRHRFPGILPRQHATEAFRFKVFKDHWDGISRSRVAEREAISGATVERHAKHFLRRLAAERSGNPCPQILGIDEHFFSRKHGYATTFCDLKNHSVYDVALGRSQLALEAYLNRLDGKHRVRIVCMDLASSYRATVRKHFPNAKIIADRFHVIRLINQHFLACWRQLDPEGSKNRGLISLMRRHRHNLSPEQQSRLAVYLQRNPVMEAIYRFKQRLCYLLLNKHRNQKQCARLAPRFLTAIYQLRQAQLPQLVTLGETLASWSEEIAAMWRFTRNNGITEGFHTKMEVLQRQAYGFRNIDNYRLRVKVLCS
jgi:transposase